MIVFDKLLGKPAEWKLTESEIQQFSGGIYEIKELDCFFNRLMESRNKKSVTSWEYDAKSFKQAPPGDIDGQWGNRDEVDGYLDFLGDLSDEEKIQFEENMKAKPPTMSEMWDELHHLDKYQVFKNDKSKFFDWMNALDAEDYNYYTERVYSGKRLLNFERINEIKESKIKTAFDELLKIIDSDIIRVSLDNDDKSIVISSTNINSLDDMVTKLQSLGGVFSECEYTYKKKEMITVHYYTFRKL